MDTVTTGEVSEKVNQAAVEARKQFLAERHNGIGLPWPDMVCKVPLAGPFLVHANTEDASGLRLIDPDFNYHRDQDQIYTSEWLEFTAEISNRLGYVLDETYQDNQITLGDGRIVSKRMAAFLAMLYDFGFHGDHNKRMPDDPSKLLEGHLESQNTQFHHYLGVALITSKVQGNGLNDDILVALAHDMFDSQPKKKIATDEVPIANTREDVHVKDPSHIEVYRQKINQIWGKPQDTLEQPSAADKIIRSGPEMDLIELVAELCRPSHNQNVLTASDLMKRIESIGKKIDDVSEHVDVSTDKSRGVNTAENIVSKLKSLIENNLDDFDGKKSEVTNEYIAKFSQELRNQLLPYVGRICSIESIRAMAANLTHNMLFPRRTDKGEDNHPSVKRDADEAIEFYVHLLEFREEQEALRALKDISYRIKYPDEYLKLTAASDSLKADGDPIKVAIETLADNLVALKEFMREHNFNVITQEDFEREILERRKKSVNFKQFIDGSQEVLSQFLIDGEHKYDGVIVLQKPRIKGLGSIMGKVLPFKDKPESKDPYHQAILAAYPGIERYSQEWWKHLITMMGDPLATRMVFHLGSKPESSEDKKNQLSYMKSLLDVFLNKQKKAHRNSIVYRADAKAIGEKIIEAVAKPRRKGFLSAVGKTIAKISNIDSLRIQVPEVGLKKKNYSEIIAEMKYKDHYKAYHLALAVRIVRGLKRLFVGVDMHLMDVYDYLVSVYGESSHLNYKLGDNAGGSAIPDLMTLYSN
jgi:hypothetical protein